MNPAHNIPELISAAQHTREAPPEFQKDDFEALPIVVDLFKMSKGERNKRITELRDLLCQLDADVAAISNVFWEGFNKSTKSYSRVLQLITESHDNCESMQKTLLSAGFRPVEHQAKQSQASPFACARSVTGSVEEKPEAEQIEQEQKQRADMGTSSVDKLSYLWSKSLEYEYTIELVRKIQCLRDSVAAATEFMDAGYFLHAASVIQKALEIIKEIQQYDFFGTNRLCGAVRETRLKLTVLLCRRLNDLVNGHKREQKDSLQIQPPQIIAAFSGNGEDREPFHLSFSLFILCSFFLCSCVL